MHWHPLDSIVFCSWNVGCFSSRRGVNVSVCFSYSYLNPSRSAPSLLLLGNTCISVSLSEIHAYFWDILIYKRPSSTTYPVPFRTEFRDIQYPSFNHKVLFPFQLQEFPPRQTKMHSQLNLEKAKDKGIQEEILLGEQRKENETGRSLRAYSFVR